MRMKQFLFIVIAGVAACGAGAADSGQADEKQADSAAEENVKRLLPFLSRLDGVYSVFEAARAGDEAVFDKRLAEGSSVNERDEVGNTPMHVAASAGKVDMVIHLLQRGADPLAKNKEGKIPLELAKDCAMEQACRQGIEARREQLKLIQCISDGDADAVRKGVRQQGISPNALSEDGGSTLLIEAVKGGDTGLVQDLLAAGADPNLQPATGNRESALVVAAKLGATDIVKALLAAGADINMRTTSCVYPIHEAVWNKHLETVKALLPAYRAQKFDTPKSAGNPKPVCMAIKRHNADILQAFIEAGLDPNDTLYAKEPLLILAVKGGDEQIVSMLLKAGADKTARDGQGKSAADYAQGQILQLLQ